MSWSGKVGGGWMINGGWGAEVRPEEFTTQ